MQVIAYITVRGLAWSVCEEDNPTDDNGDPVYGICDRDARKIIIDSNLSGLTRSKTLIHEITHATSEDVSEEFVEALEESLAHSLTVLGYDLENVKE